MQTIDSHLNNPIQSNSSGVSETMPQKKESLTDRLNLLLPQRKHDSPVSIAEIKTPVIPRSVILSITLFAFLLGIFSINTHYLKHRIVWHTSVGSIPVGGKTVDEARRIIRQQIDDYLKTDIPVQTGTQTYSLSHQAVEPVYQIEEALDKAYRIGKDKGYLQNALQRFLSLFSTRTVRLNVWFNEERLKTAVTEAVPLFRDQKPLDAGVTLKKSRFVVIPGKEGMGFDEPTLITAYRNLLEKQTHETLNIQSIRRQPDIDDAMAIKVAQIANNVVGRFLVMRYSYDGYNYDSWTLSLREVRDWFEFRKEKELNNYNLYVVLNNDKIRRHISRRIAPYMYVAKEDIIIHSVDGKPVIEGIAKDGYYLDLRRSVKSINDCISMERIDTSGNLVVWLDVAHLTGGVANPDNEFGISDVLATGVTDFYGSPENRKFNIKHASSRFQNIILHPGERFSFIKYMGKVDSANGFLKELVIVDGDSTEPQYGGGICQVSSTLFRTIFFAGLPVISRVSHSFEVKYYRPPGLDATIFDPYPNLVFENDTKNLLLIQNYVDLNRTKMYFKFFGKKDGRRMRFEGPIFTMNVGEKKEHYRVTWYRTIEFPDGTVKTEKFNSLYLNKELVKKHQPENLLIRKDSIFVPVPYDSTRALPTIEDTAKIPSVPFQES